MTLVTVKPQTPAIAFTILGKAVPSGVRPVPIRAKGGLVIGSRIAEGNDADHEKRIKSWKQEIAWAARHEWNGDLYDGAVAIEVIFYRQRPKSHYGTGRNAAVLKASAPRYPVTTPDTDKLSRLVRDALKGVVYTDDSRIVEEKMMKLFGDPVRVEVVLWFLDLTDADAIPGQTTIEELAA